MNSINQKQNDEKILKYLFVQRFLYSKAKTIGSIAFFSSLIFYLIGIIPYLSQNFETEVVVISSLGAFFVLFMEWLNTNKKEKAVDYQEYIDRTLFEFKINKKTIPNLNKLENQANEIILNSSERYQEEVSPNYKYTVYSWYSDVVGVTLDVARVICQNENVRWENRQRSFYSKVVIIVIILLFFLSAIKLYKYEESFINLIYVLPISFELIKILISNLSVTKLIKETQDLIEELYINIEQRGSRYNKKKFKDDSTTIQENIRKYRLNNISVPDFIYKRMKIKEQMKSSKFIAIRVREILNNI